MHIRLLSLFRSGALPTAAANAATKARWRDEELTAAFTEWAAQVLLLRRFRGSVSGPLQRLKEVRTMTAETVEEWTAEWVEQGREQGGQQGDHASLCHQVAQKVR